MSESTQREELAEVMSAADCASSEYPFSDESRAKAILASDWLKSVKAEALRDAAALIGTHGYLLRWADVVADHTTADWLRDYADAIEKGV